MDEILITPPYGVDDCKANASSSALLARIKKVVTIYYTQLTTNLMMFVYSLKEREEDLPNRKIPKK